MDIKYVGDNVDKHQGVRDLRSDKRSSMIHMYSMLVVKSRVSSRNLSITCSSSHLQSVEPDQFLPSLRDLQVIKGNLIILVSRVLCKYINALTPFSSCVTAHISHAYSEQMAQKSEVHVVDVLMKNETKHSDIIDIMLHQQSFIPEHFPSGHKILSGGDHVTCETQVGAQRQRMDGDTSREKLLLLEPQVEDWHTLMTFLSVSKHMHTLSHAHSKSCITCM